MQAAEYCFAPAGDTPTSSRLYSSLAAGCVPVVLADSADEDVFPFPASLDWSEIAVVAPIPTDRTDVAELAAILRAEGPEAREKRRDAGAAAFDNHLDYIGNARGVADATARTVAVAVVAALLTTPLDVARTRVLLRTAPGAGDAGPPSRFVL